MSQEYTEDKDITLKKLSAGRRLLEAMLIVVVLFAIYLAVALLSFSPSDPSWSQTAWHEPIHNLGGGVGAWLADTLFFVFWRTGVCHSCCDDFTVLGCPSPARTTRHIGLFCPLIAPYRHISLDTDVLWAGGA
ncbi:hypothetical protein OS11_17860 [Dickeya oryzae]